TEKRGGVPKGREIVAGGGAKRNHRTTIKTMDQAPEGRQKWEATLLSPLPGRSPWWGMDSGGSASLHHRLLSLTPPAPVCTLKCITAFRRSMKSRTWLYLMVDGKYRCWE